MVYTSVTGLVLKQQKTVGERVGVVLLTPERGKIMVWYGGERRFKPLVEPLNLGTWTLLGGRSWSLKEVHITDYYTPVKSNFESLSLACLWSGMVHRLMPEDWPQAAVFELLTQSLAALSQEDIPEATLRVLFPIRLLTILGHWPVGQHCAQCGQKLDPAQVTLTPDGELWCARCGGAFPVFPELSVKLLHYWQTMPTVSAVSRVNFGPEVVPPLQQMVDLYQQRLAI